MALSTYRKKRDFTRTPEPAGVEGSRVTTRGFVVQRHRARRLHYDFRLELDGVLVSWAVPKGPTLDAKVRRGAYHVEDHPLGYAGFEGVIPAGQYGGGDVIVWDNGTWEPRETNDPAASLAAGELHFDLYGVKLHGRFVLIRTKGDDWLLLHKNDDHAVAGWNAEDHPLSVLSGRTNDDVKVGRFPAVDVDSLTALDALGKGGTWEVFGRSLRVTNLDKVLFPGRDGEAPVTKREFLRYTAQVAPTLVPYLTRRALNLHRYPDGADKPGFWHKELPHHAPDWLPRWDNPEADPGETRTYLVVDEPAALVWAANFGGLEWHPWTSQVSEPHEPSYALIDLDPGVSTRWEDVLELARLHRTAFEHLGVTARAKVTGRRGIQIWVPIQTGPSFDETRSWVESLSRTVGAVMPELVSWKWQRSDRGGRARLDYTQNAINKTLVAPYSPRPAAGAPVSAPIEWDELDDPSLRPDGFTIRTIVPRLAERGDLFREVLDHPQQLPPLT